MQTGRRARFGALVLAAWALAVLILLLYAHLTARADRAAPYDGASFVRIGEADGHA